MSVANRSAFGHVGPDSVRVDSNARLISEENGDGMNLTEQWNIVVNGYVAAFGNAGSPQGIDLLSNTVGLVSNVTVGSRGTVFGENGAIFANHATNITNFGKISSASSDIDLGGNADVFTNFTKSHGVMKSGTIIGLIDLGDGDDIFHGGSRSETVSDGTGGDTYTLGGGNDVYLAVPGGGPQDLVDFVDGGKGIDTYNASAATSQRDVNLGSGSATGVDVTDGLHDDIRGIENVIGGSGGDFLFGSSVANRLEGRDGGDSLAGEGGNDSLNRRRFPDWRCRQRSPYRRRQRR